jgi:1,5-anhydro-D-fructose reductase (1,5-anhydro-D-mannitol-forming)
MRVVRWGMIGAGDVTEHKSGPAFQKADRSELVAVMRRTPGKAAEYARRHRVPHHYEVALDLIRDPMVDAIYIASPPGSHAQLALLAAEAGKPTYVEKPMARNFHECKAMNDTFAARGIPLFVAYYRRALPRFLSIKAILDENGIGAITAIVYRYACEPWNGQPLPWRLRAEESGGGLFLDVGCHVLDLLDFLFGPLANVSGSAVNRASRYDVEDHVSMQFETPSCATCNATWDFAAVSQEDSLQIFGTEGSLRMSVFGDDAMALGRSHGEVDSLVRPNPPHVQQPLIQSIVDELCGMGTCASTGESAARTSRVMDTVLTEYYGGRADGFWNRVESWPGRR